MTTNIQLEEGAKQSKLKNFRGVIMRDEMKKNETIRAGMWRRLDKITCTGVRGGGMEQTNTILIHLV